MISREAEIKLYLAVILTLITVGSLGALLDHALEGSLTDFGKQAAVEVCTGTLTKQRVAQYLQRLNEEDSKLFLTGYKSFDCDKYLADLEKTKEEL
jgi:hypothetical protein